MARWFVIRDGSEHGPLTDAELKSAAAAGKIRPDDAIRRDDTASSRPAREVKGLTFAPDLNSRLITADDDFESIDPFNLKAASPETGITACLEEKEKIQTLLLPRAYAALGKKYFEAVDHSPSGQSPPPEVAPFVEQIVALLLNAPTPSGPGTQSATDPAREKAVEHQLAKKYAQLGKRAYEVGGLTPAFLKEHNAIQDLVQRDKLLIHRISALRVEAKKKREAEELASQVRKAKETAGAVLGTVSDAGVSLLYSTPVVVLLATLIPPLGLWLIWQHPTWGIKSKTQWAGLSLACFLSLIMANQVRTAFQNATEATQSAKKWAMEQANSVAGIKDTAADPEPAPQAKPQSPSPKVVASPTPTPPAAPAASPKPEVVPPPPPPPVTPTAPTPQTVAATVPSPPAAVTPPAPVPPTPVAPASVNPWQEGAQEFQGHLYKVLPEVMTWIAAKQKCEAMGGRLAVIDTPGKSAFLKDIAARSGISSNKIDGIWLGGTDKEKEGDWVWLNGRPVTYAEWGPGQPNNKDNSEHYIMIFVPQWQWSDQPSTSTQHTTCFACEWESPRETVAEPPPPTPQKASISLIQSSLAGWRPHDTGTPGCWVVRDGELIEQCAGTGLVTEQVFLNFDMHVEFLLPPKANSGIYLRGRYEVQLLDQLYRSDNGQPAPPLVSTGAIWKRVAPTRVPYRGPNQWNSLDVTLIGTEVTVTLNGETVIDRKNIPGVTDGALDNEETKPGPFLIQKHLNGDIGVRFRNFTVTRRP